MPYGSNAYGESAYGGVQKRHVVYETIGTAAPSPDFSTLSAWDASSEGLADLLHIGVICGGTGLIEEYDRVRDSFSDNIAGYECVLVTSSGDLLFSFIDGTFKEHSAAPHHAIDETDPYSAEYRDAVRSIRAKEGQEGEGYGDLLIYRHRTSTPSEQFKRLQADFDSATREVIDFLAAHPEYMRQLQWRQFEKLLDRVFAGLGYQTELGPGSGDQGVDLRLIEKSDIGSLLILVQAKRYSKDRPITLRPVHALYGTLTSEGASKGVLAATSYFQPAAKEFERQNPYRIHLAGPKEIRRWLEECL